MTRFALVLLMAAVCAAEIRSGKYHNRDCWVIENVKVRVNILTSGGHIAEIVLKAPDAVNPLWLQKRPTIDAEQYDPARHEAMYGGGSGARLMSGLAGHNVCFPFWGNPSETEAKAGMTFHGETGIARWKRLPGGSEQLVVSADLPESRTRLTRQVRLDGQVAVFEETAENLSGWDRPVGWCEHVTIGPPFLEKGVTVTDASLTRGRVNGDHSGKELHWPADLRTVRNVARSGFVDNFLVDPQREYGFFAVYHPRLGQLFGYLFRRSDFPWLNIWEANNPDMLTRGMEFSNTPVHGTMKALYRSQQLFGVPTFEWLDARSRLTKRYAAWSTRAPAGYRGVADVRLAPGKLEVVERDTGRVIALDLHAPIF